MIPIWRECSVLFLLLAACDFSFSTTIGRCGTAFAGDHSVNEMELEEALTKAGQILDEERAHPAVHYAIRTSELLNDA